MPLETFAVRGASPIAFPAIVTSAPGGIDLISNVPSGSGAWASGAGGGGGSGRSATDGPGSGERVSAHTAVPPPAIAASASPAHTTRWPPDGFPLAAGILITLSPDFGTCPVGGPPTSVWRSLSCATP